MNFLIIIFSILMVSPGQLIFDFQKDSDLSNWRIVDDVVMGGRSDGNFGLNEAGHAVFQGTVSLENYGGFSSVRHRFKTMSVDQYKSISIRLKGDGKRYQFRLKTSWYDRHSYIYYFETNGDWQTINIPLSDLKPTFRGRALAMPNFPGQQMEELAILIGNKKPESFRLEIDKINLE